MPAPLAERLAPSAQGDLLQTVGTLYRQLADLAGNTDFVTTIELANPVYDGLRLHLIQYCDVTGFVPGNDTDSILWNGVRFMRHDISEFVEAFNWVTQADIDRGWANTPRVGEYYNGNRIARVTYSEAEQGYEVYTLMPRSRHTHDVGETYIRSGNRLDAFDARAPSAIPNAPVQGLPDAAAPIRDNARLIWDESYSWDEADGDPGVGTIQFPAVNARVLTEALDEAVQPSPPTD